MINFLVKLSESDKRVLIALCLVFIILFVIVGYLVKLIRYIIRKKADFVENSMYDLLDANVIEDKKHFRKVSWKKNRVRFYFDARVPVIFILLSLFIILLYMCVVGFDISFIIDYNKELKFTLDWSETGDILLGFIPVLAEWPKVVDIPTFHFDRFDAWLVYIFDIGMIYGLIHFFLCSTFFLARNIRTITVANEYFKKDLNKLKEAKLQARGIHTKEPSEEMKEEITKAS